jgi:hypothetical protein
MIDVLNYRGTKRIGFLRRKRMGAAVEMTYCESPMSLIYSYTFKYCWGIVHEFGIRVPKSKLWVVEKQDDFKKCAQ